MNSNTTSGPCIISSLLSRISYIVLMIIRSNIAVSKVLSEWRLFRRLAEAGTQISGSSVRWNDVEKP